MKPFDYNYKRDIENKTDVDISEKLTPQLIFEIKKIFRIESSEVEEKKKFNESNKMEYYNYAYELLTKITNRLFNVMKPRKTDKMIDGKRIQKTSLIIDDEKMEKIKTYISFMNLNKLLEHLKTSFKSEYTFYKQSKRCIINMLKNNLSKMTPKN